MIQNPYYIYIDQQYSLLPLHHQGMAINGSSRIIEEFEARNGIVYAVSNQIIEDIFSMLPYMVRTIGVDVSIMIEALEKSGVSNMIDHCNYFNYGWIKTK